MFMFADQSFLFLYRHIHRVLRVRLDNVLVLFPIHNNLQLTIIRNHNAAHCENALQELGRLIERGT